MSKLDGHLTELHNLGNDLEEWCEVRVRKDCIPKGARLVEAYMTEREVIVIVGDGSYLMLNSELATSLLLDRKLIVVVLDNHGYACINRLQQACGGEPFNNLLSDTVQGKDGPPRIDFAAHAAALGATAENVKTIPELEAAMQRARSSRRTYVICIETDPARTTQEGGWWWEVAVPEVSVRGEVVAAHAQYVENKRRQEP